MVGDKYSRYLFYFKGIQWLFGFQVSEGCWSFQVFVLVYIK